MARFRLLLLNEFKLARTAIPVHAVAIVQPSLFFLLISLVLVQPTFQLNVTRLETAEGWALVAAMEQVGSPAGVPYIEPILVETRQVGNLRQLVTVEEREGLPVAVQRFGLIDANQVKNLRNRLTAASLRLWDGALGGRAVRGVERPWLPSDMPYTVYFGLALLPLGAMVAGSFMGAVITTQDLEFGTALEYRLSPVTPTFILGARLVRLVLSSLLAAGLLLAVTGVTTGIWPGSLWRFVWVTSLMGVVASSVGLLAGLWLRRTIPAFAVSLCLCIAVWIFGGAFGLPSGFGGTFETISRLTPSAYAVELLFPTYYGVEIGDPIRSAWVLVAFSLALVVLVIITYHRRVVRPR
jgi:ABC-type multidrug transport system permease subunit